MRHYFSLDLDCKCLLLSDEHSEVVGKLIPVCPYLKTKHTSSARGVILDVQSRLMQAHMKGRLAGLPLRSAI